LQDAAELERPERYSLSEAFVCRGHESDRGGRAQNTGVSAR